MKLLAISGKKEVGKDTVADMCIEALTEWGWKGEIHKIGFADGVYEEVAIALLHADGEILPRYVAVKAKIDFIKANKPLFRTILQWWGTDYRRKFFGEKYWVERAIKKINKLNVNSFVIVNDVRFKNEYDVLNDIGAALWRVERKTGLEDSHQSEVDIKTKDCKWSHIIYNDSSLAELKQTVRAYLKELI